MFFRKGYFIQFYSIKLTFTYPGQQSKKEDVPAGATTFDQTSSVPAADVEKWYNAVRYARDSSAGQQLQTASRMGNHLAEAYLSALFDKGCNIFPKDTEKATEFARKALPWLHSEAAKGNKDAQFHLGFCLADGRGIADEAAEAVYYYKLACNQGHALAQFYLGKIKIIFSFIMALLKVS